MKSTVIFDSYQPNKYSKTFRVDPGFAIIISSFNFSQGELGPTGDVIKAPDCAVLHKVELGGDVLKQLSGCRKCENGVIEGLKSMILKSEPVIIEGCVWSHNADTNLSVISVPGYYMFEFCNADDFGQAIIQIEEVSVSDAMIIPKPLFFGA